MGEYSCKLSDLSDPFTLREFLMAKAKLFFDVYHQSMFTTYFKGTMIAIVNVASSGCYHNPTGTEFVQIGMQHSRNDPPLLRLTTCMHTCII